MLLKEPYPHHPVCGNGTADFVGPWTLTISCRQSPAGIPPPPALCRCRMSFMGRSVMTLRSSSSQLWHLLSLQVLPYPSLNVRKRHFGGCELRERQPWVYLESDIWEMKELLNENLNEGKVQPKQNYIWCLQSTNANCVYVSKPEINNSTLQNLARKPNPAVPGSPYYSAQKPFYLFTQYFQTNY